MSEFKAVTQEEFFSVLRADKRDIMPTITERLADKENRCIGYVSEWREQYTRQLFGKSCDIFGDRNSFWLVEVL